MGYYYQTLVPNMDGESVTLIKRSNSKATFEIESRLLTLNFNLFTVVKINYKPVVD